MPQWSLSSRDRLTPLDAWRFGTDSLFDAVGRVVCDAQCLPRKELYESWAVAKKVLRRHRGGGVLDLAGGHGLVGYLMAIQDRGTTTVRVVDTRIPKSALRLRDALATRWPGVSESMQFLETSMHAVPVFVDDRVLGIHACGTLTDDVLSRAVAERARVAVLPCCHPYDALDDGNLAGWMPADVAIDAVRALRLRDAGYQVWTTTIPSDISPMNRLLLGSPTPT